MIELKFKGKCEDCKCADLELKCSTYVNNDRVWVVKCKHKEVCDHMEDYISEKLRNE